jgi:hypothetical protein
MIPEPPDRTRLAIHTRPGSTWCRNCTPEWLVIWRDDERGNRDWIVPAGAGSWFSDHFDASPWAEFADEIVEMFDLTERAL